MSTLRTLRQSFNPQCKLYKELLSLRSRLL